MSDRNDKSRGVGPPTVAALTAGYGLLMIVANWRNDFVTNDLTTNDDWLLFGGDSGFPADFGRSTFAGTVALGLLFVGLAVVVAVIAETRAARPAGAAAAVASLVLVAAFSDSGSLLGAKPSAAAVLLAIALYLIASSLDVQPSAATHPPP
jgi:hypothetical protein